MLLIKLGGSVITDKKGVCKFLEKRTRRIAEELRFIDQPIILTHGGGSFGHFKASKYSLKKGRIKDFEFDQTMGFSEVHNDMRTLNTLVLDQLIRAKLKVVSVSTSTIVKFSKGKMTGMDFKNFDEIRSLGAIPVGFGDVVHDSKIGFTICSADDLMIRLAKKYKPKMAVFVTNVDGIFKEDPNLNPHAPLIPEVRSKRDIPKQLLGKANTEEDVTGGMIRKTRAALEMAGNGVETWIINGCVAGRLSRILKGYEVVGTKFIPKKSRTKKSKAKSSRKRKGGQKQ